MANRIVDEVAETPDRNPKTKSGLHPRRVISTVQKVAEDPACNLWEQQHFLDACSEFSSLESVDERFVVVRRYGLCFRCLRPGQAARGCLRSNKQCGKNGCKSLHHHTMYGVSKPSRTTETRQDYNKAVRALRMVSQRPGIDQTITLINIVPVKISNGSKRILTYAMIDPGAEVTLIRRKTSSRG